MDTMFCEQMGLEIIMSKTKNMSIGHVPLYPAVVKNSALEIVEEPTWFNNRTAESLLGRAAVGKIRQASRRISLRA